jgi:glutathione synthase/RimK-type ligase-like ATP-grasp enzyme
LYFVGSEAGPPLQDNYVETLQAELSRIMANVRVEAISAVDFIALSSPESGVIWPYFRGAPLEGEDVLGCEDLDLSRFGIINDYRHGLEALGNKWTIYERAKAAHLPVPQSFHIRDVNDFELMDLSYPIVVKGYPSGRGADVHLCRSFEEASAAFSGCKDKGLGVIAQEYIAESRGKDLRVLVVDGEIAFVGGRQGPEGAFLSNISRGGSYVEYSLSLDERAVVEAAIKAFPLDIGGFDFLFSDSGLLFCEINLAPGWTGAAVDMVPLLAHLIKSRVVDTLG